MRPEVSDHGGGRHHKGSSSVREARGGAGRCGVLGIGGNKALFEGEIEESSAIDAALRQEAQHKHRTLQDANHRMGLLTTRLS